MNPFFQHRFRHLVRGAPPPPAEPPPPSLPLRLLRGLAGLLLLLFAGAAVLVPAALALLMLGRALSPGVGLGQRLGLVIAALLTLSLYISLHRRRAR